VTSSSFDSRHAAEHQRTQPKSSRSSIYAKFGAKFPDIEMREKNKDCLTTFSQMGDFHGEFFAIQTAWGETG